MAVQLFISIREGVRNTSMVTLSIMVAYSALLKLFLKLTRLGFYCAVAFLFQGDTGHSMIMLSINLALAQAQDKNWPFKERLVV